MVSYGSVSTAPGASSSSKSIPIVTTSASVHSAHRHVYRHRTYDAMIKSTTSYYHPPPHHHSTTISAFTPHFFTYHNFTSYVAPKSSSPSIHHWWIPSTSSHKTTSSHKEGHYHHPSTSSYPHYYTTPTSTAGFTRTVTETRCDSLVNHMASIALRQGVISTEVVRLTPVAKTIIRSIHGYVPVITSIMTNAWQTFTTYSFSGSTMTTTLPAKEFYALMLVNEINEQATTKTVEATKEWIVEGGRIVPLTTTSSSTLKGRRFGHSTSHATSSKREEGIASTLTLSGGAVQYEVTGAYS